MDRDTPGYVIINEAITRVGLGDYEGDIASIADRVVDTLEGDEAFNEFLSGETIEEKLKGPLTPKAKQIVKRIARRVMRSLAKGDVIYDE